MIFDLTKSNLEKSLCEADVLVIGSGVAGLMIAVNLIECGQSVILVESGNYTQDCDEIDQNEVVNVGQKYLGAKFGRFRCLGGTSTRWGGALIPFVKEDLNAHALGWTDAWPLNYDELISFLEKVESTFCLPKGDYLVNDFEGKLNFIERSPKWPTFARRNLAKLFSDVLDNNENLKIYINANLVDLEFAKEKIICAHAISPNGKKMNIFAAEVVVAAGAIESTRILLNVQKKNKEWASMYGSHVGNYFSDHISAPIGLITPVKMDELVRLSTFKFQEGAMRNIRFEYSPKGRIENKMPGAFAHISFDSTIESGFEFLREIYRAIQSGRHPNLSSIFGVIKNFDWFVRAVYARLVKQIVLPPDSSRFEAHLVIEQEPFHGNQLRLSEEHKDCYGNPMVEIDWRVRDSDINNFIKITSEFEKFWNTSDLKRSGNLNLYPQEKINKSILSGGEIFHPTGTLRMSLLPQDGVVDKNLRVHGISNLYVASTAVFPSGGASNPTMTLCLLSMRLVKYLRDKVAY